VLLDRYIVDFYAPAGRLVVEVDGGYHALLRSADKRRDRELRRGGYQVVRVSAALVMTDAAQAARLVERALSVH
jgi:very-short-patch-repair endonuclease